jgi:D-alanyl-D-alanine carboxypeptidase
MVVAVLIGSPFAKAGADPSISARAAFLMNANTGEVLYQNNADLPLPPASTTKVMTSILALESGRLDETVIVPREATLVQPTKIRLKTGERVVLRDLVYSLLLNSANDASIAVAIALAGSVDRFGEEMTARAIEFGAFNTRFRNPHGLTQEGHYTTARDLALIFLRALNVPLFREITRQREWIISASAKRPRNIALRSHNRLLWEFDGPAFGKTGYTLAAQRCFVGSVSKDGTELILSMLGAKTLWADARNLVEFGFGGVPNLFLKRPPAVQAGLTRARLASAARRVPRVNRGKQVPGTLKYAVQLAAFQNREKATGLRAAISQKGYRAVVEEALLNGGAKIYRVRVGSFATIQRAKSAARRFTQIVGYRGTVVRAGVF